MQMKKPAWASMPVLDVRALTATQVKELAAAYDRLSILELAPIAQLDNDPVRQEIDAALCKALGLPGLSAVRELLAREPGLTAEDITPRKKAGGAPTEAAAEDEEPDQLSLDGVHRPKGKTKRAKA